MHPIAVYVRRARVGSRSYDSGGLRVEEADGSCWGVVDLELRGSTADDRAGSSQYRTIAETAGSRLCRVRRSRRRYKSFIREENVKSKVAKMMIS